MTDNGQKETVEAQRRRRSGRDSSQPRGRADAPQRRRETTSETTGGGGSGGGSTPPSYSLPSLPGGKNGKSIIGMVVVGVIFLCIYLVFGGQGLGNLLSPSTGEDQMNELPAEPSVGQAEVNDATPTRRAATATKAAAARTPASAGNKTGQTWLVLLYQDADDQILEQDIFLDLNEAEKAGSSDRVQVVAQIDRFRGAFQGDGNWTGARRYHVEQDDDLNTVTSPVVDDLGEVDMSNGSSLVDFVDWAVNAYPADKYVLVLSDHGMGWPGGWSDPDPGGKADQRSPMSAKLGNHIFLMELDEALASIKEKTGIEQFELIGMDACLMAQVEVFSMLEPYARFAVASEEVEPGLGWAYAAFLQALQDNPDMDGAELGKQIVQNYIQADERIVDDQARAEFLRANSPSGGFLGLFQDVAPRQLAQQIARNSTLTAVDLGKMPAVMESLNQLAYSLQSVSQPEVARARTYAQSFTSIFGEKVPPSFIDIGSFTTLLANEISNPVLQQAADDLLKAIDSAVIAEKHGADKAGATGLSIYFPASQLYRSDVSGAPSYTVIAGAFAETSLWDEFLNFHYTGLDFEPETQTRSVPQTGSAVRGPGAGAITVSGLQVSSDTVAPGQSVTLSADIQGDTVGYVYLFVGYLDEQANSIYLADLDYLESSQTKEANGVFYPVWSESGDFTLSFKWEPIVFALNDGTQTIPALFTPRSFGASFEEATYTVEGTYTFGDGSQVRSLLLFTNGVLKQVLGFSGDTEAAAPREITPQPGDTFTLLDRWMDLDDQGKVMEVVELPGQTITFSDQPVSMDELDAAAGRYVVGFWVEDLDGNRKEIYTTIEVR